MDSINRTESVFTDKTNTITKNGVTKNVFSKPNHATDVFAEDQDQENQPIGFSGGKCSSLFGCEDAGGPQNYDGSCMN